jgi:hypothetical protein
MKDKFAVILIIASLCGGIAIGWVVGLSANISGDVIVTPHFIYDARKDYFFQYHRADNTFHCIGGSRENAMTWNDIGWAADLLNVPANASIVIEGWQD